MSAPPAWPCFRWFITYSISSTLSSQSRMFFYLPYEDVVFICGFVTLLEKRVRVRLGFAQDWKWSAQHSRSSWVSVMTEFPVWESSLIHSALGFLKDLKRVGWFCWMSSSQCWICLRVSLARHLFMCEATSLLYFFLSSATGPCKGLPVTFHFLNACRLFYRTLGFSFFLGIRFSAAFMISWQTCLISWSITSMEWKSLFNRGLTISSVALAYSKVWSDFSPSFQLRCWNGNAGQGLIQKNERGGG